MPQNRSVVQQIVPQSQIDIMRRNGPREVPVVDVDLELKERGIGEAINTKLDRKVYRFRGGEIASHGVPGSASAKAVRPQCPTLEREEEMQRVLRLGGALSGSACSFVRATANDVSAGGVVVCVGDVRSIEGNSSAGGIMRRL